MLRFLAAALVALSLAADAAAGPRLQWLCSAAGFVGGEPIADPQMALWFMDAPDTVVSVPVGTAVYCDGVRMTDHLAVLTWYSGSYPADATLTAGRLDLVSRKADRSAWLVQLYGPTGRPAGATSFASQQRAAQGTLGSCPGGVCPAPASRSRRR